MKKTNKIITSVLSITMLITLTGCSFLEKDVSRKDTIDMYNKLTKQYEDLASDESGDLLANLPIKKITQTTVISVKEKGTTESKVTETKTQITKTGDKSNLCLEIIASEEEKKDVVSYVYIENGKYYMAEDKLTNTPTEIDESTFGLVSLVYLLQIFELDLTGSYLKGTGAIKDGFVSAKKDLLSMTIISEVEYTTTTISLEKTSILKLFQDEFRVNKIVEETKEVVGTTTTTTTNTIKYSY